MGPNSELAKKLFAAVAAGDEEAVRRICAPGLQFAQNGGPPADLDALVGLSAAVRGVVPDFRYANAVRSDTVDGFVEEHDFMGTLPDGTECCIAACLVARVEDGRIVTIREYFDSAAAAALFKALGA